MTSEFNQIINLVKSKNEKVEHISYKEVYKLKLNPENNNNTSIVFNTQNNSSQLIDYSNAYFQFIFNIKFATDQACTKTNLTLKNSYEMIQELKIELNNKIISNEYNTNYSYIINHLLENSKNDDLIYRNIDIHQNVVKYNDTDKDIFLTKNGDTMKVTCNVFLKDISNFFKNLDIPLEFAEFNLTLKLVDQIYVTDQDNVTQTLVSSHLYVDRVILHEIEKLEYLKNHNNFNVNITFLENYVKKDSNNITNENFDVFVNNVRNCNDLFLLLIKDNNNTLKLPNKKCKNLQLYIDNQKFQTEILSDLDAYTELKNRSEYTNEFTLDYNRFLNNYTIYSFPIYRNSRFDKNNKYINISGLGVDDNDSKAIIIWRKKSNINLKINNNFLDVTKTY